MPKHHSDTSFVTFVCDQLSGIGEIVCRPMFGGYGLYHGRKFFGILFHGRLYFKVDHTSVLRYQQHGMKPFRPNAKQTLASYYEVPADILEDADELIVWTRRACDVRAGSVVRTKRSRST